MTWDSRTVALALSFAGFLVDTAWALSTFALSEPFLPLRLAILIAVAVIPIYFLTVMGVISGSGGSVKSGSRPSPASLWNQASPWERLVTYAPFLALWTIGMTALWSLRHGGPEIVHGQFFANNHGSLTPISRSTFHSLQLAEQRLFSAVPAALYLLAALYNGSVAKHNRSAHQRRRPPLACGHRGGT
jgi:hypothetical protein